MVITFPGKTSAKYREMVCVSVFGSRKSDGLYKNPFMYVSNLSYLYKSLKISDR